MKNFDWRMTEKELLIFIPNYKRGKYIRKTIDSLINTSIPFDRFKILIINDAFHEDFSDLIDKNVLFFTFERENKYERGDAFLRNIVIKHSKSVLLMQKDPEIFYNNDFIKGCFEHQNFLYRCGKNVYQVDEKNTQHYFNDEIDSYGLTKLSRSIPILEDRFVFFHYGWSIQRQILLDIGGYDESYKYYGYVDTDLHDRLMKLNIEQYFDHNCQPVHLWHEKPKIYTDAADKKRYEEMGILYNKKRNEGIIRNIGVDWGNGDPNCLPE